jgi:hypothetical protein
MRRKGVWTRGMRRGGFARERWHWFDHPEMRRRIAEAEADRREGRVTRMESTESISAYLEGLTSVR